LVRSSPFGRRAACSLAEDDGGGVAGAPARSEALVGATSELVGGPACALAVTVVRTEARVSSALGTFFGMFVTPIILECLTG
jgi:hypothetical protein